MEIKEIIKDSLMFPANNIKALAIYIVITFVLGFLLAGMTAFSVLSFNQGFYAIFAAILLISSIVVGFILAGYEIDIIKTGIRLEDVAPDFILKDDAIRGIKAVIVAIIYFIIPAVVTSIIAVFTNVPGQLVNISQYVSQTAVNTNGTVVASTTLDMVPPNVMAGLVGSLSITFIVAVILFVIFSFFQYVANARLANTDSIANALNILEAFRDLKKIGIGNVVAVVIIMLIINVVINGIIIAIAQQIPQISIISIIVTPFIMFAMNRANGLLYSDIA